MSEPAYCPHKARPTISLKQGSRADGSDQPRSYPTYTSTVEPGGACHRLAIQVCYRRATGALGVLQVCCRRATSVLQACYRCATGVQGMGFWPAPIGPAPRW